MAAEAIARRVFTDYCRRVDEGPARRVMATFTADLTLESRGRTYSRTFDFAAYEAQMAERERAPFVSRHLVTNVWVRSLTDTLICADAAIFVLAQGERNGDLTRTEGLFDWRAEFVPEGDGEWRMRKLQVNRFMGPEDGWRTPPPAQIFAAAGEVKMSDLAGVGG